MTRFGLLLALMEPELAMRDEFDDWYDFEHIPHMIGVDGILNAQRFVVVEGWPRYVAMYDLNAVAVLTSDSYRSVTGGRFSPWSRRILQRVHGWRRLTFEQLDPGAAPCLAEAGAVGILLFGGQAGAAMAASQLAEAASSLQVRRFAPAASEGPHAVVWEAGSLEALARPAASAIRESSWSARMVRYSRTDPVAAFSRLESSGSP